jgi:hypothetical protein
MQAKAFFRVVLSAAAVLCAMERLRYRSHMQLLFALCGSLYVFIMSVAFIVLRWNMLIHEPLTARHASPPSNLA